MLEVSVAVVAFDPLFDLLGRRNDDVDVFAEREAEIFRRAQIERIDQRDCECVVRQADRQSAMQPREPAGNQP